VLRTRPGVAATDITLDDEAIGRHDLVGSDDDHLGGPATVHGSPAHR
jgi:hypothetical protein